MKTRAQVPARVRRRSRFSCSILAGLLLASGLAVAARHPHDPRQDYAKLQQKLQRTGNPTKRAELLARMALLEETFSRQDYDGGRRGVAFAELQQAQAHGQEAMNLLDAQAAEHKKLHGARHVEIQFRETARELTDFTRDIVGADQARVRAVQQFFVNQRDHLLSLMFGGSR
jgi:hypothetical protein